MYQNDYDIYVLLDSNFFATYSLQNIFSNDLSLEKFRNIKSKMHCVKYHKPWCQNTKHVFNVFLLTKTSRGLECNPYIQKFDHPLQNTTKYVVLHFSCCKFPKSYSILTWWDVCYVLSHSRNHAIFKWCDFSPFHLFFISGIPWIFNRVIQK